MPPITHDIDLWIDDDEIDELIARMERALSRPPVAPQVLRPPFHTDYMEAD